LGSWGTSRCCAGRLACRYYTCTTTASPRCAASAHCRASRTCTPPTTTGECAAARVIFSPILANSKTLSVTRSETQALNLTSARIRSHRATTCPRSEELGFEAGAALEHINLHGNRIGTITGLQNASGLAHLDIGSQRPAEPPGTSSCLRIDVDSLWGIAPSLRYLNASGNSLGDDALAQLVALQHLRVLDISGNEIGGASVLAQLLFRLPLLTALRLKGNPLTARSKWREALIMAGVGLEEIDGKPIATHERAFLLQLAAKRAGMRPQATPMGIPARPATTPAVPSLIGEAPPLVSSGSMRSLPTSAGPFRMRNGVQQ